MLTYLQKLREMGRQKLELCGHAQGLEFAEGKVGLYEGLPVVDSGRQV